MNPPFFGAAVWGKKFFEMFADWHLPSMYMAEIHAFGPKPDYVIYTDAETLPLFEELRANSFYDDINLILCEIPKDLMEGVRNKTLYSGGLKQICQRELIKRAWDEDRPFAWLYPDMLFGPRAYRAVARFYSEGYRATTFAGFTVSLESIERAGDRERILGFDGSPLEWGGIFLDHLHEFLTWRVWDGPNGNGARSYWPCHLYTQNDQGLFVNSLHPNPLFIYPRRNVVGRFRGLEDDFLELGGIHPTEVKAMDDGSFVAVEIATADKPLGLAGPGGTPNDTGPHIPLLTDDMLAEWAVRASLPYQRNFFPTTLPLGLRTGVTLAECKPVMTKAAIHARSVLNRVWAFEYGGRL